MSTADNFHNNNMFLDVSFEFDLKGIEESDRKPSNVPNSSAFLSTRKQRTYRDDHIGGTEHTVSTLGSTADDADDWTEPGAWTMDDADISLGSFRDFNFEDGLSSCGYDLDGDDDLQEAQCTHDSYFQHVIDKALRISSDNEAGSITNSYHGHGSHQSNLLDFQGHSSKSSMSEFGESVSSLTDALDKLNACISRTAESRRIVRDMTKKLSTSSSSSLSLSGQPVVYQRTKSYPTTKGMSPQVYQDLNNSSNSVGGRSHGSGSKGSKGNTKAKRTLQKTRRAMKKSTLSRTGVAFRPCMAELLS
jgi:hypothetical protein